MPDRLIPTIDGKRGGFLLISGAAELLLGILAACGVSHAARDAGFAWLPTWMDANELGLLWIAAGALAIAVSLVSKAHPNWERWAFTILVIPPTLWALIYLFGMETYPGGVILAIAYLWPASHILHCAGWPNPVTALRDRIGGRR